MGGRDSRPGHRTGHPGIQPDGRLVSNARPSARLAGGMRRRTMSKEDRMRHDKWASTSRRSLFAVAGMAAGSAFLLPAVAKATPPGRGQTVRYAPAFQPT